MVKRAKHTLAKTATPSPTDGVAPARAKRAVPAETPLRRARAAKGLTLDEVAKAAHTSAQQVSRLEKGDADKYSRTLTKHWAIRLAPILDVSPIELVFGDAAYVPVVGSVQPDGSISFESATTGVLPAPPHRIQSTVALVVRGSPMRGLAEDGWFVFFDFERAPIDNSLIGELCVIGLADGATVVRTPYHGRDEGLYNLESPNQPTIRDVGIEWAALVTMLVPKATARKIEFHSS